MKEAIHQAVRRREDFWSFCLASIVLLRSPFHFVIFLAELSSIQPVLIVFIPIVSAHLISMFLFPSHEFSGLHYQIQSCSASFFSFSFLLAVTSSFLLFEHSFLGSFVRSILLGNAFSKDHSLLFFLVLFAKSQHIYTLSLGSNMWISTYFTFSRYYCEHFPCLSRSCFYSCLPVVIAAALMDNLFKTIFERMFTGFNSTRTAPLQINSLLCWTFPSKHKP